MVNMWTSGRTGASRRPPLLSDPNLPWEEIKRSAGQMVGRGGDKHSRDWWLGQFAGMARREQEQAARMQATSVGGLNERGRLPVRREDEEDEEGRRELGRFIGETGAGTRAARRANISRYQQILALFGGMGRGERERIASDTRRSSAALRQSLISRGLGHSTIVGPMLRRVQEEAHLANLRLADRIAGLKAGVMERREDIGPDVGLASMLAQRYGRFAGR